MVGHTPIRVILKYSAQDIFVVFCTWQLPNQIRLTCNAPLQTLSANAFLAGLAETAPYVNVKTDLHGQTRLAPLTLRMHSLSVRLGAYAIIKLECVFACRDSREGNANACLAHQTVMGMERA